MANKMFISSPVPQHTQKKDEHTTDLQPIVCFHPTPKKSKKVWMSQRLLREASSKNTIQLEDLRGITMTPEKRVGIREHKY